MLDIADRLLLASVQTALEEPFRDPARVAGQIVPRKFARQIERNLLRLRVFERGNLSPNVGAPQAGVARPGFGCPETGAGSVLSLHSTGLANV